MSERSPLQIPHCPSQQPSTLELLLMSNDTAYLELVLQPIKACAHYKPKFGQGVKGAGLTLAQFQELYRGDSFYSWFGLDNPMMYAAHKAAGGMTSVYRQIGAGSKGCSVQCSRIPSALQMMMSSGRTRSCFPLGRRRRFIWTGASPLTRFLTKRSENVSAHGWRSHRERSALKKR